MNELFRANQRIEELKTHADTLLQRLESKDSDMGNELRRMEELSRQNHEISSQLQDHLDARRKLHNALQEAKGKIRVLARVRPHLPHDSQVQIGLD